jgi:hypothetical protein
MKSDRGPKIETPQNSHVLPIRGDIQPTAHLTRAAKKEFYRLADMLQRRGTLKNCDPSVLTDTARLWAALNDGHAQDLGVSDLIKLTNAHRGRMRDLGLVLQPSRSKYAVHDVSPADRWAHLLKD